MPAPSTAVAALAVAGRRRRHLVWLSLAVGLLHLWLAGEWLPPQLGDGAAASAMHRIEVAFVRELAPASPAPTLAAPTSRQRRLAAIPPATAASAPALPLSEAPLPPDSVPPTPDLLPEALASIGALPSLEAPLPEPASAPGLPGETDGAEAAASPGARASSPDPAAPATAVAAAPDTEPAMVDSAATEAEAEPASIWPPSTRLSYTLTGDYRGPVQGQAQVEWLRHGTRYQVHMDLSIGPAFAPLTSRRVSSEGEITPEGLRPQRYDEVTHVAFMSSRSLSIQLDADQVRLPRGDVLPRPVGVQDSASQFVQLTWLFTTQPQLLQRGQTIALPLALPRVVETWTYEVLDSQTLYTPAGPVQAVHVKPRRPPRAGRELEAEMWIAPSLQYLPVRILIRQDAQTYVDLLIEKLPQQAAPGR